jgi:hypothetical protein
MRVLHRALAKLINEEPAETIVIAFISSPPVNEPQYHPARRLAEKLGFEDSHLFSTEYLAEGEIDCHAVQHAVILRTLISRGLFSNWDALEGNMITVNGLRHYIVDMLFSRNRNAYKIGLTLGSMSQALRARAP